VRITHRYAFRFFDVLVLDCGEESVEETRGEMTRRLFCLNHETPPILQNLQVFVQRDSSDLVVLKEVENALGCISSQ